MQIPFASCDQQMYVLSSTSDLFNTYTRLIFSSTKKYAILRKFGEYENVMEIDFEYQQSCKLNNTLLGENSWLWCSWTSLFSWWWQNRLFLYKRQKNFHLMFFMTLSGGAGGVSFHSFLKDTLYWKKSLYSLRFCNFIVNIFSSYCYCCIHMIALTQFWNYGCWVNRNS